MKTLETIDLEQSQKYLLNFMASVMREKEQEEFTIGGVNLCSQFYTFIPENITSNFMLIIANEEYWKNAAIFEDGNVTDCQCLSLLQATKENGGKALFLKYDYTSFQNKLKFKRNKIFGVDKTEYANAVNFPYLNFAIDLLCKNANGKDLNDEIIQKTLDQFKSINLLCGDLLWENTTNKEAEKNIVKSLNRKKVS